MTDFSRRGGLLLLLHIIEVLRVRHGMLIRMTSILLTGCLRIVSFFFFPFLTPTPRRSDCQRDASGLVYGHVGLVA